MDLRGSLGSHWKIFGLGFLLSAFETPEDRDGLTMRATMHKIYLFDPGNKQVLIKISMVPFPMPKNTYAHPGALLPKIILNWFTPRIQWIFPRNVCLAPFPTPIYARKPASFLNYFTKVLLILFPKINSNLRPSRRLSTQILPTVGTIIPSIKIADY